MRGMDTAALPIVEALPALLAALELKGRVVLHAPPGAGKSTGVPPALLAAPWLAGQRILMLEPRRLAARTVAARIAALLGEQLGETVGYRMRMDSRVGPGTRLEVVTEGILLRQLQHDPALEQVGCVIFDEFHERSLQADLGLALVLDSQRHLRPELRLLVMSATLDTTAVARLLDTDAIISAPGLSHPVATHYLPRPAEEPVERLATAAVRRALETEEGDVLVFLPGSGEIRRAAAALAAAALPPRTRVLPLYGELPQEEQERAIRPAPPGERKVVLATNIAETSLTIEGVRVVVDGGFERRARFDPGSGMGRLETLRISRASAEQRRGRAGRLGPGVCLRLWSEAQQRALAAHAPPEILEADLAPLALELAAWGTVDAGTLSWLDAPPAGTLAQARELLGQLDAIDGQGRITPQGREMARLGTHPRLAHMLLRGAKAGAGGSAAALAALLGERDILRGTERDADLGRRLELLGRPVPAGDGEVDTHAIRRVRRTAGFFRRQLRLDDRRAGIAERDAGWLLACAYPDRIGRWREPGAGRYQLSNGRGAHFAGPQALARAEFIVAAALDGGGRDARIFLAAALDREDIERHFATQIRNTEVIAWDSREQAVLARRQRRLGALLLEDRALPAPDPDAVAGAMLEGIRGLGLDALPWTPELRNWQARVLLLRRVAAGAGAAWPDVGDAALAASMEDWLLPWLAGISRREHLARLPLAAALQALLPHDSQRRLDELAPTHLVVPSGSRIRIDYLDGEVPSLAVRLQECFGLADTPRIAGGRVPVLMKLLSPAQRPVQLTQDLRSFWERGYPEVKKELRGRYPRHYWPDDPWQAQPTRRARPR